MTEIYERAYLQYRAAGWPNVLPTKRNSKELAVSGYTGRRGVTPDDSDYRKWAIQFSDSNVALRTPSWIIGIDVDAYDDKQGAATLDDWEQRLGQLPRTYRSSARIADRISGIRWFRVSGDAELITELGPGIEVVQFHHRYGLVWPSVHDKLGTTYMWYGPDGELLERVPQPTELAELPDGWYQALREAAPSSGDLQSGAGGGTGTRSTLAQLLGAPPAQGGRNNWLTRVAGHLAKGKLHQDGFLLLVEAINQSLEDPLGSDEVIKTANSIWESEQQAAAGIEDLPTQATGWLAGGGDKLMCLCEVGTKDAKSQVIKPCSDFDMHVLGKYSDEDFNTYYRLQIESALQDTRYVVEPASLFGNSRALGPRLRALELNTWPVAGDLGHLQSRNPAGRLGHYLSVQDAPRLQIVPFMGWHDAAEGFVCDEGVITAEGLNPQGGWMPDPAIRKREPMLHQYGFEGKWSDAQMVLKETLTFQDDTVCSVFGAWWAACLVKAQLMPRIAGFPFIAIEAMSGTGKSEGFFALMVKLNGATKLGSHQTAASFRDSMAANRSGIVWIDDLDDATRLYQDIRTATNESSRSKKGIDNFGSVSVQLVAPVLLTGESLPGLSDQMALMDRLIRLDVPPAKDRQSCKGNYPQWDDILELKQRYPEMWRIAGWYVQKALHHWPAVEKQWKGLRPSAAGRHADKLTVLRAGARLLDLITGDGWHAEIVDEWCSKQDAPQDDYLVNRILPELWRKLLYPESAHGHMPVFVDGDGQVWWHPNYVADWWAKEYRGADARTKGFADPTTLLRHRDAMGVSYADRKKFAVNQREAQKRTQQNYYPIPLAISARIIEQAQG